MGCDEHDAASDVGTIHELTQWYSDHMESIIREAPEQYWWLHRRWKDTRQTKRRTGKAA